MKKLRAGSLYYAVFISFILLLIILSLFFLIRFHYIYTQESVIHEQVKANVRSGITLFAAKPDIVGYDKTSDINLFDDKENIAQVNKHRWGFFDVLLVSSVRKNHSWEKQVLIGNSYPKKERIGLYMSDKEKYLSISGKTLITGNSYLPKLGIRRAYIEGNSYEYEKLVDGEIKTSEKNLPPIDKLRIEKIKKMVEGGFDSEDSLVLVRHISELNKVTHPFSKRTIVYYLRGDSTLDYVNLEGNIILFSEHRLTIDNSSKLNNCIVISPSIKIESGFKGACQVFAMDSLWIGDNCELKFPSVAGVINPTQSNCYISVGENCLVEGGVILHQEEKALKEPYLLLSKGCSIKGIAYCNGIVEHMGKITGTLYCNEFTLKTEKAYYENHLLDVTVDSKSLSEYYIAPIFFNEDKSKKEVIQGI